MNLVSNLFENIQFASSFSLGYLGEFPFDLFSLKVFCDSLNLVSDSYK